MENTVSAALLGGSNCGNSSETSESNYETTRCEIAENFNLHKYRW